MHAKATTSPTRATPSVAVTVENFTRAETDRYFTSRVRQGGFGKLLHLREPMPIDHQPVVRGNRDTLYSPGVFDLDAGPVTITMPNAGSRYMSLMSIDHDEFCGPLSYSPGDHTFTKKAVGTRYAMLAVRTLFDPRDPTDLEKVHKLQDAIKVSQLGGPGAFEVPNWEPASLDKLRAALLTLGSTLPDSRRMFGSREQVDPVRHLIGAAMAWGGNHEKDALYLSFYPKANDGKTVHTLTVKDVPVDAFWSISVYGADGYFHKNKRASYTLNSLSGAKNADGSVTVQFGGAADSATNVLSTTPGWNYLVRLYRPRQGVFDGTWNFPDALPASS